jgi:hypothetical protein
MIDGPILPSMPLQAKLGIKPDQLQDTFVQRALRGTAVMRSPNERVWVPA